MARISTQLPRDLDSNPIPVAVGSGNRAALTAGVATSNTTVPTGTSGLVVVRSTDYFWLNFGSSGAVTAVAGATSILCPPGEGVYPVPAGTTHFAGLRVGGSDVIVQLESLAGV
jgi:hypothetical protein